MKSRVSVMDGVDTRADGGLVVMPPSVHPNGERYKWERKGNPGKKAPNWAINDERRKSRAPGAGHWVIEALRGVEQGQRNHTCARLAGYYARKGLPIDVATTLLLDWNLGNKPSMSDEEVRRTVASIYKSESERIAESIEIIDDDDTVPEDMPTDRIRPVPLLELLRRPPTEMDWLVKGLIPAKSWGFVAGEPGSGKTWLILDVALALATGRPLFDRFPVPRPRKVLLILAEDDEDAVRQRFVQLIEGHAMLRDWVEDRIQLLVRPGLSLDELREDLELEKLIADEGIDVVIVDPFAEVFHGEENDKAEVQAALSPYSELCDRLGITFILTHHYRKSSAERGHRLATRLRGSSYLVGWRRMLLTLDYKRDWTWVEGELKNARSFDPFGLRWQADEHSFRFVYDATGKEDKASKRIIRYLTEHDDGPPKRQLLSGVGGARETAEAALQRLIDAGVVRVEKDGSAHRHFLVEGRVEGEQAEIPFDVAPRGGDAAPRWGDDSVARGVPLGNATPHDHPDPAEVVSTVVIDWEDGSETTIEVRRRDRDPILWFQEYRQEVWDRYAAWAALDPDTVRDRLAELRRKKSHGWCRPSMN